MRALKKNPSRVVAYPSNKIPIAVYLFNKEAKTNKNKLQILRAPSKSDRLKYGGAICNFLLTSEKHVVYVPDFPELMKACFRSGHSEPDSHLRRCQFCFVMSRDVEALKSHYDSALCTTLSTQPSTVVMPIKGSTLRSTPIYDMERGYLNCIVDIETEQRLKTNMSENDYVFKGQYDNDHCETSDNGVTHYHIPVAIGLLFLDQDFKYLGYHFMQGENVNNDFADELTRLIDVYMDEVKQKQCLKPLLTNKDEYEFERSTNCGHCNVPFSKYPNKHKHRHHSHHIFGEYVDGELVKGNYKYALCHNCNLAATNKRKRATVIAHNGSFYDYPILMRGLCNKVENLKHINVMPKGLKGYVNVKFKNANFLDSYSFMNASLEQLVTLTCKDVAAENLHTKIPNTVAYITERWGLNMIHYLGRKQIFPYKLAGDKASNEKIITYPDKSHFYNDLTDQPISDADYKFGHDVWKALESNGINRMNLNILMEFYLANDCFLLSDVWANFCNLTKQNFGLEVDNCLTGPSLVFKAARYMGDTDLELITDATMYEDFEKSIKGGFTSVTTRLVTPNVIDMGDKYDDDKLKDDISLFFGDWNCMYPCSLRRAMPYANLEYVDDIEIYKNPDYLLSLDVSDDSDVGYFLIVSYSIPEHLKRLYDDFPLSYVNTDEITPSEYTQSLGEGAKRATGRKLIAGHFDMKEVGMDLEYLQFFIRVGVKLTEVHRVITYNKKPYFRPFIDYCLEMRNKHKDDPVQNQYFKLLANSLYGRCIMDPRRYNTTSVVVSTKDLTKAISNPRFKEVRKVSEFAYLITNNKKVITLDVIVYVGCIVLQRSKLMNLDFHYCVAKPSAYDFPAKHIENICKPEDIDLIYESRKLIKSITFVYGDTDSLCYRIVHKVKGLSLNDIYTKTFFRKYLDRSNFEVLSKECEVSPGAPYRLKLETADSIPMSAIFMCCKVYSIVLLKRLRDGCLICYMLGRKCAAKGFCRAKLNELLPHEVFEAIYYGEYEYECPTFISTHFRFNKDAGTIATIKLSKKPISMIDNKRFWLDKDTSFAYGHPDIYKHGYLDHHIKASRGGYISSSNTQVDEFELANILYELLDDEDDVEYERECLFNEIENEIYYVSQIEDVNDCDMSTPQTSKKMKI